MATPGEDSQAGSAVSRDSEVLPLTPPRLLSWVQPNRDSRCMSLAAARPLQTLVCFNTMQPRHLHFATAPVKKSPHTTFPRAASCISNTSDLQRQLLHRPVLGADSSNAAGSDATAASPTSSPGGTARSASASSTADGTQGMQAPVIVSLEPQALVDVAESCVTVGRACGVLARGEALRDWFLDGLRAISNAVGPTDGLPGATTTPHTASSSARTQPRFSVLAGGSRRQPLR